MRTKLVNQFVNLAAAPQNAPVIKVLTIMPAQNEGRDTALTRAYRRLLYRRCVRIN